MVDKELELWKKQKAVEFKKSVLDFEKAWQNLFGLAGRHIMLRVGELAAEMGSGIWFLKAVAENDNK